MSCLIYRRLFARTSSLSVGCAICIVSGVDLLTGILKVRLEMFDSKKPKDQAGGWGKVLGTDESVDQDYDTYDDPHVLGLDDDYDVEDISDSNNMSQSEAEGETVVFSYTVGKSQLDKPPLPPSEDLPDGFWEAVDGEASSAAQQRKQKSSHFRQLFIPTLVDLKAVGAATFCFVLTLLVYKQFFAVPTGSVDIASSPEGARIFLNGEDTGFKTPHQFHRIPVGETMTFSLAKMGYKSRAENQDVIIEDTSPLNLFFQMYAVQTVRINTKPEGAFLKIDGEAFVGATPMIIRELPIGQVSILEIEAEGYIPQRVPFEVSADVDEVSFELDKAVDLVVLTQPPGAEVKINDTIIGQTPLYEHKIAVNKSITVAIKKIGYEAVSHQFRVRADQQLEFTLNRLSLAKLPLSKDDRLQLRQAQRKVADAKRQLRMANNRVRRSENTLKRVEANPKVSVSALINAKQQFTQAQENLSEKDTALQEAVYQLDDLSERLASALGD